MIDLSARRAVATLLRRLASGRISTSEYESACAAIDSNDEGVRAVLDAGWSLYSDYKDYRLRGRDAPAPETIAAVARCVLFLKTDFEYEWPLRRPSLLHLLIGLLTLGIAVRRSRERWERSGDYHVWPFRRYADYKRALARPPFLAGVGSQGAA
jgi:hypothetical protein